MRDQGRRLKAFSQSERGNVAVIAALSLLPIILVMGLGFDLQRVVSAKMRIQSSMDAALLTEVGYIYQAHQEEVAKVKEQQAQENRRRQRNVQQAQESYQRSLRRAYRNRHTRSSRTRSYRRYQLDRRREQQRQSVYVLSLIHI